VVIQSNDQSYSFHFIGTLIILSDTMQSAKILAWVLLLAVGSRAADSISKFLE